jgi:FixJ family two-component response regulator
MSSPSRHLEKRINCVLDDDLPNLKAVVRLLRAVGFQTVPFESPRLFLEYVKDHPVCLAIIDLRMPELSGLEVQHLLCDVCPKAKGHYNNGRTRTRHR